MSVTPSTNTLPCPDPECRGGFVIVHDAYAADPLVGEKRLCDRCFGCGFILPTSQVAIAN